MNRKLKISLIIAVSLLIIGGSMFAGALAVNNWDFKNLSTVKYQNSTYEIDEEFYNISIKTETDDIVFKKAEDKKCKVEFFEDAKIKHSAIVEGDTLTIEETDNRTWLDYIQFLNFGSTKITVYLPTDSYDTLNIQTNTGDINIPRGFDFKNLKIEGSTSDVLLKASISKGAEIKVSTGDIKIDGAKFGELKTSVTTGDTTLKNIDCEGEIWVDVSTGYIKMSDVTAKSFKSSGSTGDIDLKNVIIKENMYLDRSTGDIKLINSDAGEMFIKTSTGDVEGTLLSGKIFITETETGTVRVPKTTKGGKCQIKTDTGDIKITIKQ